MANGRLEGGVSRVGVVGQVQGSTGTSSLTQAASASERASAELAKGMGTFGDAMMGMFTENKANSDIVYIGDALNAERLHIEQNRSKYENDPSAYVNETAARREVALAGARSTLSKGAFAQFEVRLGQMQTDQHIGFMKAFNGIQKSKAYGSAVDSLVSLGKTWSNSASTQGMTAMYEFLDQHLLMMESLKFNAKEGNYGNEVFQDGSTKGMKIQRLGDLIKTQVLATMIGTHAKERLTLTDKGMADDVVEGFVRDGILAQGDDGTTYESSGLSATDRATIGRIAQDNINNKWNSMSADRKAASIQLIPEFAIFAERLREGKVGREDIPAFVKTIDPGLYGFGQISKLYDAVAVAEHEEDNLQSSNSLDLIVEDMKKHPEKYPRNQMLAVGEKNKLTNGDFAKLLRARGSLYSDIKRVESDKWVRSMLDEIRAAPQIRGNRRLDSDRLHAEMTDRQIPPESRRLVMAALSQRTGQDLDANDTEKIFALTIDMTRRVAAGADYPMEMIHSVLESEGLHKNQTAISMMYSAWVGANNSFESRNREVEEAGHAFDANNLTPKHPGAEKFMVRGRKRLGINFNGPSGNVIARLDDLRAFYGRSGVIPKEFSRWLDSVKNHWGNSAEVQDRLRAYTDMTTLFNKPFMLEQIPEETRVIFNTLASGIDLGKELPAVMADALAYLHKNDSARDFDVAKYAKIGAGETIEQWLGRGAFNDSRLENAMESSLGAMRSLIEGIGTTMPPFIRDLSFFDSIPEPDEEMFAFAAKVFEHQATLYSNPSVALAETGKIMMKRFQVSKFGPPGGGVYRRQAVSAHYADDQGKVSYVPFQVAARMNEYFTATATDNPFTHDRWIDGFSPAPGQDGWWLEPTRESAANPLRAPAYEIHYFKEGRRNTIMDGRTGRALAYVPDKEHSRDDEIIKDLKDNFRKRLGEGSAIQKAVDAFPGGASAFVSIVKSVDDVQYWAGRSRYLNKSSPQTLRYIAREAARIKEENRQKRR